jgi:ADP-heptose:LPS heptosyltransferase
MFQVPGLGSAFGVRRNPNLQLNMNTNGERGSGNSERPRILVVRLRLIGDVVFTTPLIRALRREFPGAHLSYLVEPLAAPIVSGNPHLDEVILAPKRRGLHRWSDDVALARRLHAARYDVAIDLHGGPRAAWLTWATRAPMRIGYTIPGRSWMYTHVVQRAPDLGPRHSVLNQWDLLAPLGIGAAEPERDAIEIAPDPRAAAAVHRRLRDLGIDASHELVVIHVSAGNPFRRWPPDSFVELVVHLASAKPRRRILLTSGPSELAAARSIASAARARLGGGEQVPESADFSLAELRTLVDRAAVYIGGDSGPLHVASASTAPIVALFGPTLSDRSMPWRSQRLYAEAVDAGPLACRPCSQRVCVTRDFRCLTHITPRQVIDAAERAMRARNLEPKTAERSSQRQAGL